MIFSSKNHQPRRAVYKRSRSEQYRNLSDSKNCRIDNFGINVRKYDITRKVLNKVILIRHINFSTVRVAA